MLEGIHSTGNLSSFSWLSRTIISGLPNNYTLDILAILLVFYQTLFINRLCIKHRLSPEVSLFAGVFYVWLTSLMPDYVGLSPYLIANTFLIPAFAEMFKTYKRPQASINIFNVGFWIGVSASFAPLNVVYYILGIFGFLILRSFKVKEFFQFISGGLAVLFMLFSIQFLNDDFVVHKGFDRFPSLGFAFYKMEALNIYKFLFFIILSVFTVFNYRSYTIKKSIQAQKKIDILYWLLIVSGIVSLFFIPSVAGMVFPAFIALSIFLSINFVVLKNPLLREMLHLCMIGLLLIFHYLL